LAPPSPRSLSAFLGGKYILVFWTFTPYFEVVWIFLHWKMISVSRRIFYSLIMCLIICKNFFWKINCVFSKNIIYIRIVLFKFYLFIFKKRRREGGRGGPTPFKIRFQKYLVNLVICLVSAHFSNFLGVLLQIWKTLNSLVNLSIGLQEYTRPHV
jgi:hypothetical protein